MFGSNRMEDHPTQRAAAAQLEELVRTTELKGLERVVKKHCWGNTFPWNGRPIVGNSPGEMACVAWAWPLPPMVNCIGLTAGALTLK